MKIGYLIVMPDLSYGTTKNIKHPYGAYHVIARPVVDMLYGVKNCARKITLPCQEKISSAAGVKALL